MSSRRWPWVTTCLIGMNLVLFLLFHVLDNRSEQLIAERGLSAIAYYQRYPYLELKPPLDAFVDLRQSPATDGLPRTAEIFLRRTQQTELDSRVERFAQATDRIGSGSFGYIPHDNNWWQLITYQFMHRGWVHLLGNLLFLGLVGGTIENAWGRRQFVIFYVSAGIAAAIVHKLLAVDSSIPLFGASGAIAGVMGAFLFRHAQIKIRMGSTFRLRPIIWNLPVFLMLGSWVFAELIDGLTSAGEAAGVAHFAHLGGFAYGLAIALARSKTGIERRIEEELQRSNVTAREALALPAAIVIPE